MRCAPRVSAQCAPQACGEVVHGVLTCLPTAAAVQDLQRLFCKILNCGLSHENEPPHAGIQLGRATCVEDGHYRQAAQVLPADPHVLFFREGRVRRPFDEGILNLQRRRVDLLVAAAAEGGATESNAAIIKANAETRTLALEALIGGEGISAACSAFFFVAP